MFRPSGLSSSLRIVRPKISSVQHFTHLEAHNGLSSAHRQ